MLPGLERKKEKSLSRIRLLATPWTVADQAPPSMGFSRQEYWSGLPFPSPEDLPDPGIGLASLVLPAFAGRFFINCATWEVQKGVHKGPMETETEKLNQ